MQIATEVNARAQETGFAMSSTSRSVILRLSGRMRTGYRFVLATQEYFELVAVLRADRPPVPDNDLYLTIQPSSRPTDCEFHPGVGIKCSVESAAYALCINRL